MAPRASKAAAEPRYKCKTCGKLFSRSDSLKRHQAIHDSHHVVKPRKRSCVWCSKAKVRCTGERPSCTACKRREQPCVYEACRSPEPEKTESSLSDGILIPPDAMEDTFDYSNLMGSISYQNLDLKTGMMHDVFGTGPDGHPFDLQAVPFSDILDMPSMPTTQSIDTWGVLPVPYEQSTTTTGSSPTFSRTTGTTPSANGYAAGGDKLQSEDETSVRRRAELGEAQMRSLFPEIDQKDTTQVHTNWQQDSLLKSQQAQALCFPDRVVPALTARSGAPKNTTLTSGYDFAGLQSMLERRPWPHAPTQNALTKEELESCIELYFTHFHPHYAIIHRPTFIASEAPIVLVLAMATLGAALGGFEGSAQLADCLGEWTRRFLGLLLEYNPKHARADYWLTAQALQGIFARLSGNAKLFDFIEQLRGALIDNAACVGYHQIERTSDLAGKSVEEAWKTWIAEERKARLVWLIFEYDASACVLFNARPYIRLAKLRTNFPCDDALWDAPNAAEWDLLRQSHALSGPFFPELLDQLSASEDDSIIREIRNMRHLKLLMTSIARMQWTWKEIPSSTPNYFARLKSWKHNNNIATDIARTMSWLSGTIYSLLKGGSSPKDTRLAVANLHIAHMSHLQSAGELLDWLHPFLRGDNPERARVEAWRARWALQSLSRVRQAAFNCGQLIGLARRYPACFLQQSYCTFHAGTILWAIAPFLNGPLSDMSVPAKGEQADGSKDLNDDSGGERHSTDPTMPGRRSMFLDEIPRLDALGKVITPAYASTVLHQQKELTGWLQPTAEDDTRYAAAIDGIPDVTTPDGRRRVLEITVELLRDLASPGIAHRFSAVIGYLLEGKCANIHEEGLITRHHMMLEDR